MFQTSKRGNQSANGLSVHNKRTPSFFRKLSFFWKFAVLIAGVLGALLAVTGVGWSAHALFESRASLEEFEKIETEVKTVRDIVKTNESTLNTHQKQFEHLLQDNQHIKQELSLVRNELKDFFTRKRRR